MRLLFVNANRSRAHGGVERWMIDAAAGLGARGHTCVLVGRPDTAWLEAARRHGLRVRADLRGTWAQRVLRVRAAMRAERPDLVIVKAKKAARMAAFGRSTGGGGRVVLYFGLTHEFSARRWIDRFTWQRCIDAALVGAEAQARWYLTHGFGPREKLHLLWRGIALERFDVSPAVRAATRAGLGLEAEQVAVGTVGRLAWQKGLDTFIDAARLVRAEVPGARFFVVGGGSDAEIVARAAASPALGGSVTLLGPRDDVPALLAAFDVVVQSSRREVMAQTLLEAMGAGRPLVSTATLGADDAIEDGVSGILVPVGNAAALAARIVELAGDPERRAALGAAAHRRVVEHFTFERMLDRCERIFQALAPDASRPLVDHPSHAAPLH